MIYKSTIFSFLITISMAVVNSTLLCAQDFQHLIMYGQSLSTGQQSWPPLNTIPVEGNYMIGTQVWINYNNTSTNILTPLVANIAVGSQSMEKSRKSQISCENSIISAANHVQLKTGGKYKFIATSSGTGGKSIEELSKEYFNPVFYNFSVKTLNYAKSIKPEITCPAIFWMQGEYNYKPATGTTGLTKGSVATGDKTQYKELLIKLKNNMQSDVKTKYNQSYSPFFITYQVGAEYTRGKELAIGMAQLEASNEYNDIVCAGPIYHISTRGGHRDPNGYRWYGEILGKVFYKTKILGEDFKPLQPIEISRTNEPNLIKIKFHVPQPPLVFDNQTLPLKEKYGFEIYVDGIKNTINQIVIEGDQVLIRCVNNLSGKIEVVYGGESNKGQGNLRDSDSYPAFYKYIDLDGKDSQGNFVFERETTETTLRPDYEPKDNSGIIYDKPYPLYNFCVVFYYKLESNEDKYIVPHLEPTALKNTTINESVSVYVSEKNILNVKGDKLSSAFITIYDMNGRSVASFTIEENDYFSHHTFHLPILKGGIYLIRINSTNILYNSTFVI